MSGKLQIVYTFSKLSAYFSKPCFPPAVPHLQSGDNDTHYSEGLGGWRGRALPKEGARYSLRNVCWISTTVAPGAGYVSRQQCKTPFTVLFIQKIIRRKRKEKWPVLINTSPFRNEFESQFSRYQMIGIIKLKHVLTLMKMVKSAVWSVYLFINFYLSRQSKSALGFHKIFLATFYLV